MRKSSAARPDLSVDRPSPSDIWLHMSPERSRSRAPLSRVSSARLSATSVQPWSELVSGGYI